MDSFDVMGYGILVKRGTTIVTRPKTTSSGSSGGSTITQVDTLTALKSLNSY